MKRLFTLEYWKDDGWYVGKLKEIPSIFSQGETLQELKENIRESYQLMMKEDEVLPVRNASVKEVGVEV